MKEHRTTTDRNYFSKNLPVILQNFAAWLRFKTGQALRHGENFEFLEGQFCKEKPYIV